MNKIPLHRLSEQSPGEIAIVRYISEDGELPAIDYAHKDDYYMFFFVEGGSGAILLDFQEFEVTGATIRCILPGQIHLPLGSVRINGWVIAVDSMLIKDEYKEFFEAFSMLESNIRLTETEIRELGNAATAIHRRFRPGRSPIEETVLRDMFSGYIGMFAEIYQRGFPVSTNNRLAYLTFQFKKLLSIHYQSLKRPSQYASLLNISTVYLNEAVKNTTGLSASEYIHNEIILQARRLLYYTRLSVKEVAQELGYDDYAYFTRLFTKISALSPTQFRKKYLD